MLSMPVFDAASSSSRSTKRPASMSTQAAHTPHGVGGDAGHAVEALREDARDRRLADAARAGQQVRVVQAAARQRIGERGDDVLLPDELARTSSVATCGRAPGSSWRLSRRLATTVSTGLRRRGAGRLIARTQSSSSELTSKEGVASRSPGTCRESLWLLPSGPDQVHDHAMRGDPPLIGAPMVTTIDAQSAL